MFGSMSSKANQTHIVLSGPMTSIVHQGSSLGSCPTFSPIIPKIIDLRVIDLVSSPVWWVAETNIHYHFEEKMMKLVSILFELQLLLN